MRRSIRLNPLRDEVPPEADMKSRPVPIIVALAVGLLAATLPVEAQKAGKVWQVGVHSCSGRIT